MWSWPCCLGFCTWMKWKKSLFKPFQICASVFTKVGTLTQTLGSHNLKLAARQQDFTVTVFLRAMKRSLNVIYKYAETLPCQQNVVTASEAIAATCICINSQRRLWWCVFTARLTASHSYSSKVNSLTLIAKVQSQNKAFSLGLR